MIRHLLGRRKRCIVVALDGVGYRSVRPELGRLMPTLASMARDGGAGRLSSPLPAVSSVAWASFATASNPGRHGVFGFTLPGPGYETELASSATIRVPTLWDRAAIEGLRSVVVNLPGTYPARPMNGTLVSGFVAPSLDRSCHPAALADRLRAWNYSIDVDVRRAEGDLAGFLRELEAVTRRRIDVMRRLLGESRWALAILAFTEPDRLLHACHPGVTDDDAAAETLRRLLRDVDAFADELQARHSDATIIAVSDHGFAPLGRYFNVNAWLRERGELTAGTPDTIGAETRAFAFDPGRIYINTMGRFRSGIVDPGEARAVAETIGRELLAYRTPDGAQPVVAVIPRREAYSGALTEMGPNLLCLPGPGWELKASTQLPLISEPGRLRGTHTHDDALFIANRPARAPVEGRPLHDVGATVMGAIGIEADDVDGRSLL